MRQLFIVAMIVGCAVSAVRHSIEWIHAQRVAACEAALIAAFVLDSTRDDVRGIPARDRCAQIVEEIEEG